MVQKAIIFSLSMVLFILFIFPLSAEDTNCTTAKCHTDFKKLKTLHEPVSDDCTTCHEKTGDHKFTMADQAEMCVQCHDGVKEGKHVHEALEGDCTACHNPHGGNAAPFLKGRLDTLCFECHDQDPMKKKVVHGPVGAGDCTSCHKPHASDNEKLLNAKGAKVCTQCHDDMDFAAQKIKVHSVLEDGCGNCHNPHASDFPLQLSADVDALCGQCHDDVTEAAQKNTLKHSPLETGRKCMNCHDPHAARFAANLLKDQSELCTGCHKDIGELVAKKPNKHGPVADGDCVSCHGAHGSNFPKLLIKSYPERFYTSYDVKKYGLCFECHDDAMLRSAKTLSLTEFRDGDRNLHHLHVNKQRKGRTCRACHEMHAGDQPKMLRKETPFGKWKLPIGFTPTPTGGSCAPGCHKPFTYKRGKK